MKGPDHFFSLEPADLKRMVSHIRQAEIDREKGNFKIEGILYGNSAKICHQNEKYLRDFAFMTLFAAKNIKKGEIIRPENVLILRPGKKKRGLDPKFLSLFQNYSVTAKKNLAFEDSIDWDAIL
jgi:N-acetylneuraminate synthase